MSPEQSAGLVKRQARELGFDTAGIADLSPPPHADALRRWLDRGHAGTMTYMHRQAAKRLDPSLIARGATRAVVVTRFYASEEPEPAPDTGRVARYARRGDYHDLLREPLEALASFIRGQGATVARAYVDAGPVPERDLAQRAGLGWIGKNTMLIDPARGSWFFIGSVLTDLNLATDPPFEMDRCGTCTRCLDACPTGAFPEPHVLDATKCISYLTIEHRGELPRDGSDLHGWIFGCDICNEVCPWNESFALGDGALASESELARLPLEEFETLDDAGFADRYGRTALSRPGLAGLRRNARAVRECRGS